MNKILDYFKTYFKNRTIPFYLSLGGALLSIVAGICYIACLGGLDSKYVNVLVCILPIVGAILLLVASLFKQTKIGVFVLTALDFASLIVFAVSVYEYPLEQVMVISNIMDIPHMIEIIVIATFFLISTIICNVMCWLTLDKKEETQTQESKGE